MRFDIESSSYHHYANYAYYAYYTCTMPIYNYRQISWLNVTCQK